MKPVGDYLFIEKDIHENVSASGIILTGDLQKEGAATGTILAVGPKVDGFEPGQRVVFNENQYDFLFVKMIGKETYKTKRSYRSDEEIELTKHVKTDVLVGKAPGIYAYVD